MTDGFALKSWVIDLVNKVTKKSNKYSTDETVVGRWIDGRPIYRKVIKLDPVITAKAGSPVQFEIDNTESRMIDTLVDCSMLRPADDKYVAMVEHGYGSAIDNKSKAGKTLVVLSQKASSSWDELKYAVLEYTKTTDKATT